MTRHLASLLTLILASLWLPSVATAGEEPIPRILVSGEGTARLAPDMATLILTVTREAETARAALDANSAAMQEVLAILAEIIKEIFAMESGVLRAQKYTASKGEEKAKHQLAAVIVYVDETIPRIERWAKKLVAYVEEGDMLRTQFAAVKKLARYQPVNTITLKRQIADKIIDTENYPFFEV